MEVFASLALALAALCLTSQLAGAGTPTPTPTPAKPGAPTRICVAETLAASCRQMSSDAASHGLLVSCVVARDRFNCLEKVSGGIADFMQVDPEDIYLATSFKDGLKVIKDIRTDDKAQERFRSKNVAVVHKNLRLKKISDLRGRKSCHTGIARNAGLIISKLASLGALEQIASGERSSRETEMRSVSQFFGAACLVGRRSADDEENDRLKRLYPNLCALCADPGRCDFPDALADADGALRCLTDAGGDVAWTKTREVDKHFGLAGFRAEGHGAAADFRFLCTNATTAPLDGDDECRWGARPWEAFVTGAPPSGVARVRSAIGQLDALGKSLHADWLKTVLAIDNKSSAVDNELPVSPRQYLDLADYTHVGRRDFGPPSPLRICVTSQRELAKCAALSASAFSRALRPRIACARSSAQSAGACVEAVRAGRADVALLTHAQLAPAVSDQRLRPILEEQHNAEGVAAAAQYAVAVVRRLSPLRSLADLRGARSCHSALGDPAGWVLPVAALLDQSLVNASTCPRVKAVAEFFAGGSCAPGAATPTSNPLCTLCVGNQNVTNRGAQRRSRCVAGGGEEFFGDQGAFLCMTSGAGDVAFLRASAVLQNTDGKNLEHWAARLKAADYELICADGRRAAVDQFPTCNLGRLPARVVVGSGARSEGELRVMRDLLINAGELYARRADLLRLFGPFDGVADVLVSDSARGFVTVRDWSDAHRKFAKLAKDTQTCGSTAQTQQQTWNWNKDSVSGSG